MTTKILVSILELYEQVQRITIELDDNERAQRIIIERLERYNEHK